MSFSLAFKGRLWTSTVRSSRWAYSSSFSEIIRVNTCFFELLGHDFDLLLLFVDDDALLKFSLHFFTALWIDRHNPFNLPSFFKIWVSVSIHFWSLTRLPLLPVVPALRRTFFTFVLRVASSLLAVSAPRAAAIPKLLLLPKNETISIRNRSDRACTFLVQKETAGTFYLSYPFYDLAKMSGNSSDLCGDPLYLLCPYLGLGPCPYRDLYLLDPYPCVICHDRDLYPYLCDLRVCLRLPFL